MIRLNNVTFTYAKSNQGIKNINLHIPKGQFVVLTGRSGSGKTTVTRIINGLAGSFYEGDFEGKISLNSVDASTLEMWKRGKLVGSIFQDPKSMFFSPKVEGEVAFGCENYGYETNEIRRRVAKAIKQLGINELRDKNLMNLSNGEKQKVGIASIHAVEPDIYVFDEPSSNLDVEATKQLGLLMKYLKDKGKTIVVSEHRIWYLMNLVDTFVLMENGIIKETITPEMLRKKQSSKLINLGLRSINKPDLHMKINENTSKEQPPAILKIESLSFGYHKTTVFKNLSFTVNKGDIAAVTGLNGTGKTTLAKVLCGLLKEKQGTVLLDGEPIRKSKRKNLIRFIPHETDSQLFAENLIEEVMLTCVNTKENVEKAKALLESMGLFEYKDRHPITLSGGQKQRLVLATSLMDERPVLIFDEPTSGLDAGNMLLVAQAMKKASKRGMTILIITHDREMIKECCNKVISI